jgi:hypothetical protein
MRPKIERLAFGAGLLACLSWACGTLLSKSLLDRFHPLDLLVMQLSISTAASRSPSLVTGLCGTTGRSPATRGVLSASRPCLRARQAVEFICLGEAAQKDIGLWSGGKRPILVPSMGKLMIDLAAILPVLQTIFFGVRKAHAGGMSFKNAVRNAIRARGLDLCLQGHLKWKSGNPREVDAAVRIGDRLVLIECFSCEMPLDYELGVRLFRFDQAAVSGRPDPLDGTRSKNVAAFGVSISNRIGCRPGETSDGTLE